MSAPTAHLSLAEVIAESLAELARFDEIDGRPFTDGADGSTSSSTPRGAWRGWRASAPSPEEADGYLPSP